MEQENNQSHQKTIIKTDISEKSPQQKMCITDRIHSFDYLSWSGMVLLFTSIWQIAIPFAWVDSGTEKWLGNISIFIMIYSFIILAWSKHNHSVLKDFYAKSLLKHRNENKPNSNGMSIQEIMFGQQILKPKTLQDINDHDLNDQQPKETDVEILGITFARLSFILCLMLVILLSGLLVGNEIFEGYFKAIEEANHLFSVDSDDAKQASILLLSQTLCTLLTILNLLYIVYEISQLVIFPDNYPAFLNYFICTFCCVSTICFLFHIYLQNYIKVKEFNTLQHSGCITQIGVVSFISGVASLFIMFYNFINTRSKKPNQKMYLWFTVMYFVVGGVVFAQSLIIYMDVKNSYSNFHGDCVQTVRDYSKDFLEVIGCPRKYYKSTYLNSDIYDLNCNEENVGLVWEEDLSKDVSSKLNQRSCINVRCCKLIGEFSAVQFWTFLILSTSLCANSLVIFFFTLIIYTQKDRDSIKVSTKKLSSSRFAVYVIFILAFATISSVLYFFADLKGITIPSMRPNLSTNNTLAQQHSVKNSNYFDISDGKQNPFELDDQKTKNKTKVYEDIIPQSQIKGCRKVNKYLSQPIVFEKFNTTTCDNKNTTCNSYPGYNVCLVGKTGSFSLSPTFNSQYLRIKKFIVWDPYRIIKGKDGQIEQDEFCFSTIIEECNSFLTDHLYYCVNEELSDDDVKGFVKLQSLRQENLTIPSIKIPVSILSNNEEEFTDFQEKKQLNHKLNLSHKPKKGEKKEEKEEDFVTQYLPGDEDWVSITLLTFAAEDGIALHESEILVFPNTKVCEYHNFETQYPIRRQFTNINGTSIIYNLVWGLDYAIHYRHDDFLYNCVIFNSQNAGRGTNFPLNGPLVNKFKQNQNFKLLLSWSTPILSLRLSGTFNYGDTFQCQVGFYQNECGGMYSYHSANTPAQVISLNEIGQYEYLFYVEHFMEYQNLRNIQDYGDIEILTEDKLHLKMLNQLFYKSEATIKVYAKGRVLPVSEYKLPSVLASQMMRQRRPTWLAVCMDGKIGVITQVPLNKYWEKVKEPKGFWEIGFGEQTLPDASICKKYYSSNSYKG